MAFCIHLLPTCTGYCNNFRVGEESPDSIEQLNPLTAGPLKSDSATENNRLGIGQGKGENVG